MTKTPQQLLDGYISEKDFLAQIIELAHLNGWVVAHFRPARVIEDGRESWRTPVQGDPGFPDLILLKPPYLLVLELKSEKGKATPGQLEWLELFGKLGKTIHYVEAGLYRPSDWETIERLLGRR